MLAPWIFIAILAVLVVVALLLSGLWRFRGRAVLLTLLIVAGAMATMRLVAPVGSPWGSFGRLHHQGRPLIPPLPQLLKGAPPAHGSTSWSAAGVDKGGSHKSAFAAKTTVSDSQVTSIITGDDGTLVIRQSKGTGWPADNGHGIGTVWVIIMAGAVTVFLYLGYIFLDAGTRGQFTWQLRFACVLAFAAVCAIVTALQRGL